MKLLLPGVALAALTPYISGGELEGLGTWDDALYEAGPGRRSVRPA